MVTSLTVVAQSVGLHERVQPQLGQVYLVVARDAGDVELEDVTSRRKVDVGAGVGSVL